MSSLRKVVIDTIDRWRGTPTGDRISRELGDAILSAMGEDTAHVFESLWAYQREGETKWDAFDRMRRSYHANAMLDTRRYTSVLPPPAGLCAWMAIPGKPPVQDGGGCDCGRDHANVWSVTPMALALDQDGELALLAVEIDGTSVIDIRRDPRLLGLYSYAASSGDEDAFRLHKAWHERRAAVKP